MSDESKFEAGRWGDVDNGTVDYAADWLRNRPNLFDPDTRTRVFRVVAELDRLRAKAEGPSAPEPSLVYADPFGRFECKPAEASWLEGQPQQFLSWLELRVMRAHLLTALNNANAALRRKGDES
jgi:hypothetical protein